MEIEKSRLNKADGLKLERNLTRNIITDNAVWVPTQEPMICFFTVRVVKQISQCSNVDYWFEDSGRTQFHKYQNKNSHKGDWQASSSRSYRLSCEHLHHLKTVHPINNHCHILLSRFIWIVVVLFKHSSERHGQTNISLVTGKATFKRNATRYTALSLTTLA